MKGLLGFARCFVLLVFMTGIANLSQSQASASGDKKGTEAPVQFLIDSAASDFQAHRPPDPTQFRHVRLGHVTGPSGKPQYMLCGEFRPAVKTGKTEWMSFVTIKTSGYEQYLGDQATNFCKKPGFTLDSKEDFSASLKSKLDSMGSETK